MRRIEAIWTDALGIVGLSSHWPSLSDRQWGWPRCSVVDKCEPKMSFHFALLCSQDALALGASTRTIESYKMPVLYSSIALDVGSTALAHFKPWPEQSPALPTRVYHPHHCVVVDAYTQGDGHRFAPQHMPATLLGGHCAFKCCHEPLPRQRQATPTARFYCRTRAVDVATDR